MAKKKIKDFTIGEINEMCRKSKNCDDCPFAPHCSNFMTYTDKELEQEIEMEKEYQKFKDLRGLC